MYNSALRNAIKQELLDRYDISDILNILEPDDDLMSTIYDCLEELILDRIDAFSLDCLKRTYEDGNEYYQTEDYSEEEP